MQTNIPTRRSVNGRGGEIRTPDILLPKLATMKNGYSRKLCVCNVF